MTESIVFGDGVETVRDFLVGQFPNTKIASKVPNPRPPEFFVLRRVGGVSRNIITDEVTLAVEAWAPSKPEAHDLLQSARAAIAAMPSLEGNPVCRVTEFAGPADLPDLNSSHDRSTYTVSVALGGATSVTITT